ncbi:MAG: hypothetical protein ABIK15_17445 [Pseudomonadota bacterium]
MKNYRSVFILLIFLATGCKSHFAEIRENRLFFYLHHSEARSVEIRCSLDGFKAHAATKTDDDLWEVSVPFTAETTYFYIIDGEVFLPACPFREKDDFGTENCIFIPDM